MDNDTACSPATSARRQRRGLGARLSLVALLATMGLLAAACGSSPKDPGAASAGTGTTTTTTTSTTTTAGAPPGSDSSGQSTQAQQLQFAQCMRSHGVPNFPDPSAGGLLNAVAAAGINAQSPIVQAALQDCKKYTPEANMTPAQSAAQTAKGIAMSQCMRSHGVPNFPDPTTGPFGEQVMDLRGLGIDQNSPTFQAAGAACQKLFPGSK